MAQYYRNPFNGQGYGDRKQVSLWLIVADAAMWMFTAVAVISLVIVFIGRFVSPDRMWYFSLMGLVAPIIYVSVIFAMLYWIMRWKWLGATVTGLFVLLGLFQVPLYYKLDLSKQYGDPKYDRTCIKVLTFNARYLVDDNHQPVADSVLQLVHALNPDIICFQEYTLNSDTRNMMTDNMKGYNTVCDNLDPAVLSMECFTRYGTFNMRKIEDLGGTGVCISTDAVINDDTVRIYNVHLQTTSVTSQDKEYISHGEFISDSTRDTRFIQIARGLRENNALRARQAEMIRNDIAACPYPAILCGDFNDVPVSYACRTASRGLDDTFSRQGHSYAHTFRGFFNTLRIDYIFVSPDFETVSYDVIETGDISDHYPVLVRLKQTSNNRNL